MSHICSGGAFGIIRIVFKVTILIKPKWSKVFLNTVNVEFFDKNLKIILVCINIRSPLPQRVPGTYIIVTVGNKFEDVIFVNVIKTCFIR